MHRIDLWSVPTPTASRRRRRYGGIGGRASGKTSHNLQTLTALEIKSVIRGAIVGAALAADENDQGDVAIALGHIETLAAELANRCRTKEQR